MKPDILAKTFASLVICCSIYTIIRSIVFNKDTSERNMLVAVQISFFCEDIDDIKKSKETNFSRDIDSNAMLGVV